MDLGALTTNEWLTLVMSAIALIVSIVAAVFGLRLQRREMRVTVRDQLTSTVQNLIATQVELNLLSGDGAGDAGRAMREQKLQSLNHKLTSLARQAIELDKIESSVAFDVELIAIANALLTAGDRVLAERYFERAVAEAPSNFYRAINMRIQAGFLHDIDKLQRSRMAYAAAIALLGEADDYDKSLRVQAYEDWLAHEARNVSSPNVHADACQNEIRRLVDSIVNPALRTQLRQEFAMHWGAAADGGFLGPASSTSGGGLTPS